MEYASDYRYFFLLGITQIRFVARKAPWHYVLGVLGIGVDRGNTPHIFTTSLLLFNSSITGTIK